MSKQRERIVEIGKKLYFAKAMESAKKNIKSNQIKAMETSGISKDYIASLKTMTSEEVSKEYKDFCQSMKD